jgi:cyclase
MAWTRRDFLRTSSLALLTPFVPRSLPALTSARADLTELRRGVGIFTGRGGTIGWLVNRDGALAVDSQFPDTAADFLRGLRGLPWGQVGRDRADLSLDALINTHHHGDHTGGNGVVGEVAGRIVAHERSATLQREVAERNDTGGDQTYPDTTFSREWSADVGDETIVARHYGPAHTGGDCTVHFREAGVVHMGDLVFNRLHPFIDREGGASVEGWIALLEAVAAEHPADTLYIFGHGRPGFGPTGRRDDVLLERDYLSALLDEARRAHAQGRSREEVAAATELDGFPDHVPPNARLTLGFALATAYDEVGGL